jgi:hypothetical protein
MNTFQFIAIMCMMLAIFEGEGWSRVPMVIGLVFAAGAVIYSVFKQEKPR